MTLAWCSQEEKLAKIGPLVEVHQRRDKALVELERLDEVRAKVFKEGGWVHIKQVCCLWPMTAFVAIHPPAIGLANFSDLA